MAGKMTIQERFEKFNRDNPDVLPLVIQAAKEVQAQGFSHYGMRTIWERVRWHLVIELKRDDIYKLNDNFISRYARLVMEAEPSLRGFFRTRRLRAA